jgi:predicted bacteriocin transport accessory protein
MKNSENKKIIGIFAFILLFLAFIPIASYINNQNTKDILASHQERVAMKTKQIIYIGRPTCSYCQMFVPVLNELNDQYNFGYYYINTDEISATQLKTLLTDLGIDPEKFGTPYVLFMEDGEIKDEQVGYVDAKTFFNELKTNGYVEGEYVSTDPINYINFEEYKVLLAEKKNNVLVIGATTCSYCIQAKPVLKTVILDNDIVINYLEYDLLTDAEKAVVGPFLDANIVPQDATGWGTPTIMVVNDGQVVDFIAGSYPQATYETFLRNNNIME